MRPLRNIVVIEEHDRPGGSDVIEVVHEIREEIRRGEVVMVGPKVDKVKVGDLVCWEYFQGEMARINGTEVWFVPDIYCLFTYDKSVKV